MHPCYDRETVAAPIHLEVTEGGARLDLLLAKRIPDLSRRGAKKLIEEGGVFVDGKRVRVSSKLIPRGAHVVVHLESEPATEPPFSILYEDARLIAVNKHAGVQVNETETSSVRSLVEHLRAFSVHRLDRDTTGVVVLAKDADAAEELSVAFRERKVEKLYLAVTAGAPEEGVIDRPIGPDPKRPRARTVRSDGKPAITRVRVLAKSGEAASVAAEPHTGRTHQIRVHLRSAGAPIAGDLMYGGPAALRIGDAVVRPERMLLHAFRLNVPFGGDVLRFEAPLPEDFQVLAVHGLAFDPSDR
jgi:23S rRNA pseudouridine1911/1915/1917 synthase